VARKRKNGPREANGRLQRSRDRGTSEGVARRNLAYGRADIAYALCIMAANSVITVGELQACERYGFLHYAVFGRANLAAATYDGERPSGARKTWPDEFVVGRRNDYELARAGLGEEALNQLDNLVIFERFPRWLKPLQPLPSDVHHAKLLLATIHKLAEGMGYAPRVA
jgi:hypothetical protein